MKKNSILENISANLFIKLITYTFSFLTVLYITRVFQPEAYGRISFVTSFSSYFVMLAALGMPIYAMRLCAAERGDQKALSRAVNELWSIGVALSVISIIVLLFLVFTVHKLREDSLLFFIYGSGIILQAFGFEWLFKGLEKFKFLALCQLCSKAISLLCIVLFMHTSEQLPLYAFFSVITGYGSNIICFFVARKYTDLSFRIRINREHFKPLFVFFLMSCAVHIYSSLDLTMIGFMKGDYETGLYSVAAKGKSVLTLLGGVVWTSILPRAAQLWKDGKRKQFESLAGKTITIVFAIQLFVTLVSIVFARQIVTIIGGEPFSPSATSFRILMLSLVPIGVSNILGGQVLIPAGQERCLLKAEIAGAVINFIANLFIIPLYSIEGAAVTTVLSEVVVTAMCIYYARTKLQMDFLDDLLRKVWEKSKRATNKTIIRLRSREGLPYYCPCCDTHLREFIDGGYSQIPDRFNPIRYKFNRQDVKCPICGSIPRHRILAEWSDKNKEKLQSADILYFALERGMQLWLKRNSISVTTADLFSEADFKIDIENTGIADDSYDVIVANHVLEHVDDFRRALREMHRILEPGGIFICSFPIDLKVELLDEEEEQLPPQDRIRRFGQYDHKRVFGMNADQFLAEAGFEVEKIKGEDYPDEILPVIGPADYDMNILFCCRKPGWR